MGIKIKIKISGDRINITSLMCKKWHAKRWYLWAVTISLLFYMNKKLMFLLCSVVQRHGTHLRFGVDQQDGAALVALSFHSQAAEKGASRNTSKAGRIRMDSSLEKMEHQVCAGKCKTTSMLPRRGGACLPALSDSNCMESCLTFLIRFRSLSLLYGL